MKDDKNNREAQEKDIQELEQEETQAAVNGENCDQSEGAKEEKAASDPAAELAAMQEKYLYLQAEYQNYRRRMAKELSDSRRYAVEETVHPFLKVFDFLSMAETASLQSDNVESIRQGLLMIIAEYRKAFDELGLRPFDAVGEKFDPELHDAVAHESSDEVAEGVVSKQWNCGFKLGDKVLRPARVVVSSGVQEEKSQEQ